jgi:hypothetical protein
MNKQTILKSTNLSRNAKDLKKDLKKGYNFKDLSGEDTLQLIEFLQSNPRLVDILHSSRRIIHDNFPESLVKARCVRCMDTNETRVVVEIERPKAMSVEERIDKLELLEDQLIEFSSVWNSPSLLIDYE